MKKRRNQANEKSAPPIADPASEAESFGPWLRRQREGRQIELRDIAQESKISLRYLDALENNRFEGLPAPLFIKGFLRQYSSYVGLDAEEVVNYYLAAKAAADEKLAEDLPDELRLDKAPAGTSGIPYVLIALIVTAALLAIVWWISSQRGGDSAPAPPPVTEPAAQDGSRQNPSEIEAANSDATSSDPANSDAASSNAGSSDAASSDAASAGVNADPRVETPAQGSPGEASAGLPGEPSPPPASRPQTASSAPIQLVIDFTGDCWVEAAVDGKPTVAEMRVQGESLRLEGQENLTLRIGDIAAVRMEVNGTPWQPPGSGGPVREISLDLETVAALRSP